ncbi:thioredoxin family protein [Myroides sp. LJL119]
MRFKSIFFLVVFTLVSTTIIAQKPKESTWDNIEQKMQNQPRYLWVFIHTNWCNYCTLMQNKAFKDSLVVSLLDDYFYFISLDAQDQTTIELQQVEYVFKPKGLNSGIHQLAETLNPNQIYPSLILLDDKFQIVYSLQGYITVKKLQETLNSIISNQ